MDEKKPKKEMTNLQARIITATVLLIEATTGTAFLAYKIKHSPPPPHIFELSEIMTYGGNIPRTYQFKDINKDGVQDIIMKDTTSMTYCFTGGYRGYLLTKPKKVK
jgi:hypothetical protein